MKFNKNKSVSYVDTHLETDKSVTSVNQRGHFHRISLKENNNNLGTQIMAEYDCTLSKTEQQIQSHSIIHRILNNCRLKVVNHNIRPFTQKPELYRKTSHIKAKTQGAFTSEFDMTQIGCSKIQEAFEEINDKTSTTVKMRKSLSYNLSKERKSFKINNQIKKVQQISISGLINYNFRSINSRNRLAYTPQGIDTQTINLLIQSKNKSRASIDRQNKIHTKTDPNDKTKLDLNQAIAQDYGKVKTQDYLKAFIHQKNQSTLVYGQQIRQYNSLKKLSKEVPQLDQAYFMIEKIKALASKPASTQKEKKRLFNRKKDELMFQGRRIPHSKKRFITTKIFDQGL